MWLKNFNRSSLLKYGGILIIFLVWLGIVLSNVEPGTRSLGWDLMDSSFNPWMNFQRSFFGVWQEFQGLGLLGGHGYAAQFPAALIELVISAFIPQTYIRYFFAFGMLLIGSLGSYYLATSILKKGNGQHHQLVKLASTLTGLFYLLHYGTVQTFYVFLEPFAVMYAFLPWALLLLFSYLEKPRFQTLFWFLILNFFLSIIGFIPPIFISYVLFVGLALLVHVLSKPTRASFKQSLGVILILLVTNLYWLAPVTFFTFSQKSNYLDSKLNQFSTNEFIVKNQEYGSFKNVALMNSFYQESLDQNRFGTNKLYEKILEPWIKHQTNPFGTGLGYLLFFLAATGLVLTLIQLIKTKATHWSIGLMGLLSFSLLATGTPVLSFISVLFRSVSFLNQAFRIPYTKLSMSMSLFYALGLGVSFFFLFKYLQERSRQKYISYKFSLVFFILMGLSIIYYALPSFQGNFLYKGARVKVPEAYEQAIHFFETQPNSARVAPFPLLTFSGWDMHKWSGDRGYTGSGFWWYALEQPILHRSFDVWSPYNQAFYQETSTAVYNHDSSQLQNIIRKYDISFILIDESVYVPDKDVSLSYFSEMRTMLSQLGVQEVWKQDFLHVYDTRSINPHRSFVYAPSSAQIVQMGLAHGRVDVAFGDGGSYVSLPEKTQPDSQPLVFPFANLSPEKPANITYEQDQPVVTSEVTTQETTEIVLNQDPLNSTYITPVKISYENQQLNLDFSQPFQLIVDDQEIPQPSLADISLPINPDIPELILEIGDQQFPLSRDSAPISTSLVLKVGQPVTYTYFDKNDVVTRDDSKYIDPSDKHAGITPIAWWQEVQQPTTIPLTKGDHVIKAFILTTPEKINPTQWTTYNNCDESKRGSISKVILADGVEYQAVGLGAVCDGAETETVSNHIPYLLRWQGANLAGRSLKFYLQNLANNRPDLEGLLPVGQFDTTYTILDWSNLEPASYYLNWETRSFGTQPSRNQLKSITFYPLPLHQLLQLKMLPTNSEPIIQNQTVIKHPWKFGTHQYGFRAKVEADPGLVVLSQGFDPGWIAFKTNQPFSRFEHVKYNGWANAWLLPKGEYEVMILYWPQLLSFVGYGLLFLTCAGFVYIGLKHKRQRKASPPTPKQVAHPHHAARRGLVGK